MKRLDRFIRAMGSVSYERTDAEKRRLVRLMARNPGDPDGFRRQLLALLQSGDRRTQVSGIRAPTLVLHGLSDKLLPPRAGKETADLISGARLEMIPRLGHEIRTSDAREFFPGIVRETLIRTARRPLQPSSSRRASAYAASSDRALSSDGSDDQ